MRKAFNNDKLDLNKHEIVNWCLKQSKRLKCFEPHLVQSDINTRILELTSGPLEINIKARLGTELECEFEEFVNALEEITNKTRIGRMNLNTQSNTIPTGNKSLPGKGNKSYASKEKVTSKFASATPQTKPISNMKEQTCFLCKKPGHVQANCPRKKNVNNIEESQDTSEDTTDLTEDVEDVDDELDENE